MFDFIERVLIKAKRACERGLNLTSSINSIMDELHTRFYDFEIFTFFL